MTTEPKNQVQIWAFEGQDVRTTTWNDQPAWVARDVCQVCGLSDHTAMHTKDLDDEEKGSISIATLGGSQSVVVVSESGLWAIVLKSRKPEAKRFKKWLTSEVIPSIRKTGSYTIPGVEPPQVVQSNPVLEKILEILAQGHVETKARIHDIEETQSEHSKRIEHLEKVAPPEDYLTLVAFARWKGLGRLTANDLMSWGGKLKSYCRSRGIETIPIPDMRWGKVNAYPVQVITETFDQFRPKR